MRTTMKLWTSIICISSCDAFMSCIPLSVSRRRPFVSSFETDDRSGVPSVGRRQQSLTWKHPIPTSISCLHERDTKTNLDGDNIYCRSEGDGKTVEVTEYIDDCFGLIFLTGLFVVEDPIFTVTFVAISTAALVATRRGVLDNVLSNLSTERRRRFVPAMAAVTTFVLALAITSLGLFTFLPDDLNAQDNAQAIELAVCAVSAFYGVISKVDDE